MLTDKGILLLAKVSAANAAIAAMQAHNMSDSQPYPASEFGKMEDEIRVAITEFQKTETANKEDDTSQYDDKCCCNYINDWLRDNLPQGNKY